ncbi:MAG: nitroreductase family deazaflavin-dependent oxidoreductase [Thermoleophilia bacterium]
MGMDFKGWNQQVMEEFRANGGKVEQFGDAPLVILHTTGAKSGEQRQNPLMYLPKGDDTVLFASRGGEDLHPDWYHNLKANPDVKLEFGDKTVPATATEVTGAERDSLYAEQAELYPQFADYEKKTDRLIPVVVITPV